MAACGPYLAPLIGAPHQRAARYPRSSFPCSHIDFGWVFGDDPKKKFVNPPPFRISKAMVDAMGGQKGEVFQQIFVRRSLGAYKELRHNAVLVMSLLRLMKDAGIEALAVGPLRVHFLCSPRWRLLEVLKLR